MIIAIDGPAGAGKSTVAKILSQKLGFLYIDTGAMYRALTLKALENNIDIGNEQSLVDLASHTSIELINEDTGGLRVILDGKDCSALIREPRITKIVSDVSKIKGVRDVMLKLQRKLGKEKNSILDGRDIGTVVFPDANKKFYLDANPQERANRRYKELCASGEKVSFGDVSLDLSNRDKIDSTRKIAPLKKADDALYIDTTDMSIDEVVNTLLKQVNI